VISAYQNGVLLGSYTQSISGHSDGDDGVYRYGSPGIYFGGGADGYPISGQTLCDDFAGGVII
jgi:hypothetical protein